MRAPRRFGRECRLRLDESRSWLAITPEKIIAGTGERRVNVARIGRLSVSQGLVQALQLTDEQHERRIRRTGHDEPAESLASIVTAGWRHVGEQLEQRAGGARCGVSRGE